LERESQLREELERQYALGYDSGVSDGYQIGLEDGWSKGFDEGLKESRRRQIAASGGKGERDTEQSRKN
jgi:hypothetical protein